jgi:hypothetical protein
MSNVFTDADAEALAQLLEKRAIPFGGMSLEQLDGFLSGVAGRLDAARVGQGAALGRRARP